MLTPLQRTVASIMGDLATPTSFALAGGAALVTRALTSRGTQDLDYFTTDVQEIAAILPSLESELMAHGLRVTRLRETEGFVRLQISDDHGAVLMDLAHDVRLRPAENLPSGPVLTVDELAADKMLALYGRAEVRDFLDVDALLTRYTEAELLSLARSKDRGFNTFRFMEALAAIHRFRPAELEITSRSATELIERFDDWRNRLAQDES